MSVHTASAQAAGNPRPRVLGRGPSLLAALASDLAWWGVQRGSQVPFTGELAFFQCRHKSDFRPSREGSVAQGFEVRHPPRFSAWRVGSSPLEAGRRGQEWPEV